MPLFALFLPFYQLVNLGDRGRLVDLAHVDGALEESIHVQFSAFGAVAEKLEDPFQPAHKLGEEAVVVDMDLVDELVEIVLVSCAQVDERLDGLIGVGGDVLALGGGEDGEHVVGKEGEIGHGAVDIGGLVDADEGLVEDGEEVAEEVERDGLLDHGEHLRFVPLAGIHFEELFEMCEELSPGLHLVVDLVCHQPGAIQFKDRAKRALRFLPRCSTPRTH